MTEPTGTQQRNTDVLIVGAGPTGLMLANWLRRLGVDALTIDAKAGPTRESRALGVQARSMEIYDQLGIVDDVLAAAQPALAVSPGYGRRSFGAITLSDLGGRLTPYPRLYILEQSRNEELLLANLRRHGGDVLWRHQLKGLTGGETGPVTAAVDGPDGPVTISARYCVGADGSSSTVRKLLDMPFTGVTNRYTFYVADAVGVRGVLENTVNLRFGATEFLISFPMGPGGHVRLIGAVPDADPAGDADVREETVRPRAEEVFGVTYESLRWFSTYRVHHRVVDRFRDGACFLVGDAAHVHSPVGAQGMNTGLQDAHNLAFKLADVLRGGAGDATLDRYQAERRPVALRLVNSTDRVFGLVTSRHPAARLVRWVVPRILAPVAVRVLPRVSGASRLFGYLSQTRIHYWMSDDARAAAGGRRGRVVGRRLPWTGSNFAALQSLRWQVHAYGGTDGAAVKRLRSELGVDVHVFPGGTDKGLMPGSFYLVRPDGFVAAEAPGDLAVPRFRPFLPPRAVEPAGRAS